MSGEYDFIATIAPRVKRGLPNCELRVSPKDRDKFFPKRGQNVCIYILLPEQNKFHKVSLRPSFWDKCNHFGSPEILAWIKENKYYDYPEGCPPKFCVKAHSGNRFQIISLV